MTASRIPRTLSWNELREPARLIFSVWPGPAELAWACRAWRLIEEAGLAASGTPDDHCMACLRFMALGALYYDFCFLSWDRRRRPAYFRWAERLGIEAYAVGGQMAREGMEETEEDLAYEQAVEGLRAAVNGCRPEVYGRLREGFGDARRLFAALWACRDGAAAPDPENTADENARIAYQWIVDGCPPQL